MGELDRENRDSAGKCGFKKEFDNPMGRMDAARVAPLGERFPDAAHYRPEPLI